MRKASFIVWALAIFVGEVFSQKFIVPTYRPPTRPRRPIIRHVRDVNDVPLWLNQGDIPRAPSTAEHPVLPQYIDDVKLDPNRRYTRSAENILEEDEFEEHHRVARDVNDQPLWLNQGDIPRASSTAEHPVLPQYIDDVKLDSSRRYARSAENIPEEDELEELHRVARDVNDEPLWLNQGDIPRAPSTANHPILPPYVNDIKVDPLREHLRYARSYNTPSRGGHRASGTSRGGSRGHDTGATHPGYNRRNARSIRKGPLYVPGVPTFPPFNPKPRPFIPYISNRKVYA